MEAVMVLVLVVAKRAAEGRKLCGAKGFAKAEVVWGLYVVKKAFVSALAAVIFMFCVVASVEVGRRRSAMASSEIVEK